ncbi:cation channel sperm-associated auxiliary subunit epsilon [Petaurus breviceps papuanus]|uniref:cation channel sperm-associated auxiliary subunit epsilon n=1 Tax=Petaurus breviceps papuanus TaxID=3040969 RepID=UPI0036DABE8B
MFWEKVLASGVLLLCYSSALWRYTTNARNYAIFSTRTTIYLEYFGDDFKEWRYPETCSVRNKSARVTEMLCRSPGAHLISPNNKEEEERYLFVDRSTKCFMWYFTLSEMKHRLSKIIQIWIYDPENASPEEIDGTALKPSFASRALSVQFLHMGQEPNLVSGISYVSYHLDASEEEGIWETHIPLKKSNIFMLIKGNSIAFQDCFIANSMFLVDYIFLTFSQNPHYVTMTTQSEEAICFDWFPCFPATLVAVSHWETLFTKDSFNTSERIRIPPNILTDEERKNIQAVCLIEEGIVILTAGLVYLRREKDFIKLDKKYGIPSNVTGMKTRTYCWPSYTPREGLELSQMVVWSANEVVLGYSKNKFQLLTTLPELMGFLNRDETSMDSFSIHLVTYTSDPTGIAVMIAQNENSLLDNLYLVFYDENKYLWSLQDFSIQFTHGKNLDALFMYSALPNFVIWDDSRVYYSYGNYTKNGYMRVNEEEQLTMQHNSTINQVFIDYYGNGVIKLRNNQLFYFKVEISEAIELHPWINKSDNTLLLFNPNGQLFVANVDFGIGQRSEYPLMLELFSSTYKQQISCPYLLFESNVYESNIYLDKGKELTFWVQIVYPSQFGLKPVVEICGEKILKEKRYINYEITSGISTKNMTVTYYQDATYDSLSNYYEFQKENMGHLMLQLRPSDFGNTCPLSNQAIHVFVGCVAGRHLELKGQYLGGDSPKDKIVNYNVTQYGCPMKIPMMNKFQPVLLLYDGPNFVEEVKVNFIIWEIHGRKDFGYTLSMWDAGCVNEAQSWKSMKEEYKGLPMEEIWGPHNYRHCFSFSLGKSGDLSQPYEIFNLTNKNEIVWKNHHIGFYVFRAQIIDPNYRTDPFLVFIFLMAMLFVICMCLVLSYFRYLEIFKKVIYEPSLESKRKKKRKY